MKTLLYISLFSVLVFAPFNVTFAQDNFEQGEEIENANVEKLFDSDEILDITLTTDIRTIRSDVSENPEYHEAVLSVNDKYNQKHDINVKVKTRGHFRKNSCNCNLPPLKVNFAKKNTANTVFEGQNKIKLVNVCNSRRKNFEQYIIQEYLAYRTYNIISDLSFKVRLARITYEDSRRQGEPFTKYAFFIESTSDMSARNNSQKLETLNIHNNATDIETMTQVAIFQYMIGNTDWSVPRLHNVKLIAKEDGSSIFAVPYDFDWTGIVNPVYAEPAMHLGLESVRQRLYRGYERTPEQFEAAFEKFRIHKDEIYNLYENCQYLDEKQKKQSIKYLDNFFDTINSKRAIQNVFLRDSRRSTNS